MTEVEKSTKAVISICSAPHRSSGVLELAFALRNVNWPRQCSNEFGIALMPCLLWLTMPLALFVFPIFNLVLKVNN